MIATAVLALIYAGVGLAPLVYTYLAAREARSVYEKRLEEAVEEPLVPVHVVVVVRGDDVEAEVRGEAPSLEELVGRAGGEPVAVVQSDGDIVAVQAMGPRIEGIPRSLEAVGGGEGVEASV